MRYVYFLLLVLTPMYIVAVKDGKQISQADTTEKYNLRVRPAKPPRKKATITTVKETIPDLNFPPPIENDQTQKKIAKPRKGWSHAQRMAKYKEEGTLESFKEAERIRRKEYNAKFTPEQLKQRSRKWEETRKARNAAVSTVLVYKFKIFIYIYLNSFESHKNVSNGLD